MSTLIVLALLAIAILATAAAIRQIRRLPAPTAPATRVGPVQFRHPLNTVLPAAVRAIIQDGILEATFENALRPDFLFPALVDPDPVAGATGQKFTRTRTGLLTPTITPLGGSDPGAATYSIEQYSGSLEQYGNSMDTNMLGSAIAASSKYVRDVQTLGINAGQSLNQLARARLYAAYAGGRTWCRTTAGSDTSIQVNSTDGFETVLVNGVPTPVSVSNPLNITINGVANTVTGVNTGTRTLTLGTATADTLGHPVVSANAPTSIRPNARNSAYNLISTDLAAMSLFHAAVARLRTQNVPTMADGTYHAHVDPITVQQLLQDADFKQMFQGTGAGSEQATMGVIGTLAGITFVMNNEVPTVAAATDGTAVTTRRPIVLGGGSLLSMPLEDQGQLLAGTGVEDVPGISMINVAPQMDVVVIVRPAQDKLQQVVSTTWSWTGDFVVPTDVTANNDAALVKRAVVIEHAG